LPNKESKFKTDLTSPVQACHLGNVVVFKISL